MSTDVDAASLSYDYIIKYQGAGFEFVGGDTLILDVDPRLTITTHALTFDGAIFEDCMYYSELNQIYCDFIVGANLSADQTAVFGDITNPRTELNTGLICNYKMWHKSDIVPGAPWIDTVGCTLSATTVVTKDVNMVAPVIARTDELTNIGRGDW